MLQFIALCGFYNCGLLESGKTSFFFQDGCRRSKSRVMTNSWKCCNDCVQQYHTIIAKAFVNVIRSEEITVFRDISSQTSPRPKLTLFVLQLVHLIRTLEFHSITCAGTGELPKAVVVQPVDSSAGQAEVDVVRERVGVVAYSKQEFLWESEQGRRYLRVRHAVYFWRVLS